MVTYTIFNDAKYYSHCENEYNEVMSIPAKPAFAMMEGESIVPTLLPKEYSTVEEILKRIDEIDLAIVEEIARSKYLNSLQIFEFLRLRGYSVKRDNLRRKILKLMRYRIIKENMIKCSGSENGLRYYEIELKGYLIALNKGVFFHAGNSFMTYKKKLETGKLDSPLDVKRVLAGNMIVSNALKNGIKMERFGIMETFCVENMDGKVKDGAIFRTAATIKIDDESVLAYEVVRNNEDGYIKLADKIERYYKLLHNEKYLYSNHHSDHALPQMIICGESEEHNKKIMEFLMKENLWREDDTLLFTEDLLNIRDSAKSIYEFRNNKKIWYKLPQKKDFNNGTKRTA